MSDDTTDPVIVLRIHKASHPPGRAHAGQSYPPGMMLVKGHNSPTW
jgi:hypothetical protein